MKHARVLAGIDNHVIRNGSACGLPGPVAKGGDYPSVTCPQCVRILRFLDLIKGS